jgi:hypothetical protein
LRLEARGRGQSSPADQPPAAAAFASLPLPITKVTAYGAVGDGRTDSGPAVRQALTVADAVGGTLYFPTGHYLLSAPNSGGALSVTTSRLTIAGAGASASVITGLTGGAPVLAIRANHTTVQDLTLDAQSKDLGAALYLVANGATIQRCTLRGGSHFFGIYAAGDATSPLGNSGNRLLDDVVNDWTHPPLGDGISWSYQHNSTISNLHHTGSRLALYRDTYVTVTNDTFHPSTRTSQSGVTQGFWVSAPSDHISITNFVSYGNGGRISANNGATNTNVTITNDWMVRSGGQLRIDGAPGLIINGCNFGTTNALAFAATVPMSGVVVKHCSSLPITSFWDTAALTATFMSDTFPKPTTSASSARPTFTYWGQSATVKFTVNGGTWGNQAGGFFVGSHTTYSVYNLAGYP